MSITSRVVTCSPSRASRRPRRRARARRRRAAQQQGAIARRRLPPRRAAGSRRAPPRVTRPTAHPEARLEARAQGLEAALRAGVERALERIVQPLREGDAVDLAAAVARRGSSRCARNSSGKSRRSTFRLTPMPSTRKTTRVASAESSIRMPEVLRPPSSTSLGHLISTAPRVAHGLLDRLGDRHRAGEDPGRRLGGGEARAQHARAVEVQARRREERAAEPAAPRGLRLGDHGRAVRGARARELERHAVGRVGGLEPAQVARQPARRRAPRTISSGSSRSGTAASR